MFFFFQCRVAGTRPTTKGARQFIAPSTIWRSTKAASLSAVTDDNRRTALARRHDGDDQFYYRASFRAGEPRMNPQPAPVDTPTL